MTEYQTFIEAMSEVDRLGSLEELIAKGNASEQKSSKEQLNREAFANLPDALRGNISGPEQIKDDSRKAYVALGQSLGIDKADTILVGRTSQFVKSVPASILEKMASLKEVRLGIEDNNRKVVDSYMAYADAKRLPEKYARNELGEDEQGLVRAHIAEAVGEENVRIVKSKNPKVEVSPRTENHARVVAVLAVRNGYAKSEDLGQYATPAIQRLIDEFKANYDKSVADNHGTGFDEIIRGRIAEMVGDVGTREIVRNNIYSFSKAS